MGFVHLHSHTQYSIHDATNKISDYVARVKELGMNSAAITDHGVMYGCIEFYHVCEKAGIKPILGCEVYVAPGSRFEKDPNNRYHHFILLAKTTEGFYNLQKICSEGFLSGFYYKPRVDDEILEKYHEGIIATSACVAGRIPKLILNGNYEEAKKEALRYRDMFGEDNFFLEMQDHGLNDQKIVNQGLYRIHKETEIPVIATNDCHYTKKEDAVAHDVLLCMQQKTTINDPNRMSYGEAEFYVKSEEEMRKLFPTIPEAIDNTQKIADRCNVQLTFHETKMPKFPVPDGFTAEEYLTKLCFDGLNKRYDFVDDSLTDQLNYELQTIRNMGYVEYFLIVWEFLNWARENNIPVGPGRGSAAGSLVAYTTGITDIDPIKFNLQFERFLNPERVSMPDIDCDIDMRRREEVIEHVKEVYGSDNVVQIITFGTMAARAIIRDVGKALGYEYSYCDALAKKVPKDPYITLEKALSEKNDFSVVYEKDHRCKKLIDMALHLEGLPKSTGTHAAGVIISGKPTTEYIPLAKTVDGEGVVSQYTMTEVEELGLLKMDFLGLRTLTVINDAIENIEKNTGKKIDINSIRYDDQDVFAQISTGNTNGMFQLESKGMQDFMKRLKPRSLEDLIAGVALYRPGPMEFIPSYLRWKDFPEDIKYESPELEPILKNTYGCIVYQEQVTQIVRDLAGYTMGQADNIRRAMSKKKQYIIDNERGSFVYGDPTRNIPGCIKNGISEKAANKIYDSMIDFAKYAFNKSHAACYATISYQTAWLMHYYPLEYWAAIMTSVIDKSDKLSAYIQSARLRKVKISAPDINASGAYFEAKGNKIVFALSGLTGVSVETAQKIVDNRPYTSFMDAVERLSAVGVDKTAFNSLILSGAMDSFGGKRKQYEQVLPDAIKGIKRNQKSNIAGQMSLFDIIEESKEVTLPDIEDYDYQDRLSLEKDVAGVYISGHPLDSYKEHIKAFSNVTSADFLVDNGVYSVVDGRHVTFCASVKEYKKIYTKKCQTMLFLTLEDLLGPIDCIMFPNCYEEFGHLVSNDEKLLVKGKVSISEEKGASVVIESVQLLDDVPMTLWVKFNTMDDIEELNLPAGNGQVKVYIADTKQIKIIPNVNTGGRVYRRLRRKYGKDNVKYKN